MNILTCPDKLRYQFTTDFKNTGLKFSDKCCYKLKKDVALKYEQLSGRSIAITGIRGEEGGMRALNGCTIFNDDKLKKFHPLKIVSEKWEEEFINRYNIKLCKLYYPPFNIGYHYKSYKDNLKEKEYYDFLYKILSMYNMPYVIIHYPEALYKLAFKMNNTPEKVISWVYNSNTAKQHRDIAFFNIKPDMNRVKQPYKNPNDKRIKDRIARGIGGEII